MVARTASTSTASSFRSSPTSRGALPYRPRVTGVTYPPFLPTSPNLHRHASRLRQPQQRQLPSPPPRLLPHYSLTPSPGTPATLLTSGASRAPARARSSRIRRRCLRIANLQTAVTTDTASSAPPIARLTSIPTRAATRCAQSSAPHANGRAVTRRAGGWADDPRCVHRRWGEERVGSVCHFLCERHKREMLGHTSVDVAPRKLGWSLEVS